MSVLSRRLAARADRHAARRTLWAESRRSRQRECGYAGVLPGGGVSVAASGAGADRRAGFGGLSTCGSVWSCPVCSAKIAAGRQAELAGAIEAWQATGGSVLLTTLTMRHNKGQSLAELWDGLAYAWSRVTSGRAWKREQSFYGVAGWVRVVEVTHGASGWHVHIHSLLFVNDTGLLDGFSALDLGPLMFSRWRDALVRKGFAAPLLTRGGLDVRRLVGDASPLADYFTKGVYGRPGAEAGAWEVAGGMGKTAGAGNRAPFAILRAVHEDGDADALQLWHEYERASRGRRQMTWSHGLRRELALEVEASDQELAEAAPGGEVLVVLDAGTWQAWRRRSAELLDAAEADEDGSALRLLLGLPPAGSDPPAN